MNTTTNLSLCGICGTIHGPALGQCLMYLATIEAQARGKAVGEAVASHERFVSAYRRLRTACLLTRMSDGWRVPYAAFDELDELCGLKTPGAV
jgi:hypothetical protein